MFTFSARKYSAFSLFLNIQDTFVQYLPLNVIFVKRFLSECVLRVHRVELRTALQAFNKDNVTFIIVVVVFLNCCMFFSHISQPTVHKGSV